MILLRGLLILLGLPLRLLGVMIKACLGISPYRKFKHQPINLAKMLLYNAFLLMPVTDCKYVCFLPNETMLNKLVKPSHYRFVHKNCGWFGKRYDDNAIWLVRQYERKPLDPVLIYLHGGGYYFQAGPSQIELTLAIWELCNHDKMKLLVLFLDYKLALEGYTIPCQLTQLHQTYSRLVSEGAETIYLMGDLAGGNLAMAYLQYLKQNQQDPAIALLPYPKKVCLVSPWVKIVPDIHQFESGNLWYDNDGRDIIEFDIFSDMHRVNQIVGTTALDLVLVLPGNCDYSSKDWEDIPSFQDPGYEVMVLVGEDEVFRDDILEWCKYALNCPLYDEHHYGESGGVYDPDKHEFTRIGVDGTSNVSVYVEPLGVHDLLNFFENQLLGKLAKKPRLVLEIDDDQYFGILRIAKFLLA